MVLVFAVGASDNHLVVQSHVQFYGDVAPAPTATRGTIELLIDFAHYLPAAKVSRAAKVGKSAIAVMAIVISASGLGRWIFSSLLFCGS